MFQLTTKRMLKSFSEKGGIWIPFPGFQLLKFPRVEYSRPVDGNECPYVFTWSEAPWIPESLDWGKCQWPNLKFSAWWMVRIQPDYPVLNVWGNDPQQLLTIIPFHSIPPFATFSIRKLCCNHLLHNTRPFRSISWFSPPGLRQLAWGIRLDDQWVIVFDSISSQDLLSTCLILLVFHKSSSPHLPHAAHMHSSLSLSFNICRTLQLLYTIYTYTSIQYST